MKSQKSDFAKFLAYLRLLSEARRQSSVTGGAEKNFGGAHINFFLKFGCEDKKKHTKFRPVDTSRLPLFGTQFAWEGTFIAWRGAVESFGADLGFCTNSGVKIKTKREKVFGAKS